MINPESSIETINRSISKSYGKYNEMVSSGRARFNDKDFEVYDGGSTLLSGVMFTNKNRKYYYQYKKVLFYKLQEGKYVRIVLNGNDKEITSVMKWSDLIRFSPYQNDPKIIFNTPQYDNLNTYDPNIIITDENSIWQNINRIYRNEYSYSIAQNLTQYILCLEFKTAL